MNFLTPRVGIGTKTQCKATLQQSEPCSCLTQANMLYLGTHEHEQPHMLPLLHDISQFFPHTHWNIFAITYFHIPDLYFFDLTCSLTEGVLNQV